MEDRIRSFSNINNNHLFPTNASTSKVQEEGEYFLNCLYVILYTIIFVKYLDKGENLIYKTAVYEKVNKNGQTINIL